MDDNMWTTVDASTGNFRCKYYMEFYDLGPDTSIVKGQRIAKQLCETQGTCPRGDPGKDVLI